MDYSRFPDGSFGVLIYGSLFHPTDLDHLFDEYEDRVARVRADGFRRVFDAKADRRETVADRSAVLNLHREDDWCNGLLVTDLTPGEFGTYARRETTYRFIIVEEEQLSVYPSDSVSFPDEIVVPCEAPKHNDIRPIPSYVNTCLQGAREWGDEFYEDFIETTYVTTGESLAEYFGLPASSTN